MATRHHLGSDDPRTISRPRRAGQRRCQALASCLLLFLTQRAPAACAVDAADKDAPAPAGQATQPPPAPESKSKLFPPKMALGRAFILPTVHYSTERGFGLGGEVLVPFQLAGNGTASELSETRLRGYVTVKGQTQLELISELHWAEDRQHFKGKISHRATADRFYGVGPDTPESAEEVYRPRRLSAYVELFQKVLPYFKAGVRFEGEFFEFRDFDAGGALAGIQYQRTSGETVLGTGIVLDWDKRNQRYGPTGGYYYQVFGLLFDDALGSDFDFTNFNADLRNYFSLAPGHVLATQVFLYGATDSPPFWRYASLGGREHSRGYRRDRYLDQVLFAVQAEYRAPALWRLSATTFAGMATVAPSVAKLEARYLRPTLGFGINFHYAKNRAIVARFDTGFGKNNVRFDLAIGEAF